VKRWCVVIGVASWILAIAASNTAQAGTITLRPNGDPGTKNWVPSTGAVNWSIINRSDLGTPTYLCIGSGTSGDVYDLTTAPIYQGATAVNVRMYTALGQQILVLADDKAGVNLEVGGSLVGATTYQNPTSPGLGLLQSCSSGTFGPYGWLEQNFTGSWNQTQVDGMRAFIGRQQIGLLADAVRVSQVEAVITYTDPPTLDQSAWRAYQNANSTAPGTPLAATNTVGEIATGGNAFRLRVGLTVSGQAWSAAYGANKLQFTTKSGGSCAASSGWADIVSGSGAVRWNDNASAADGATISSNANDPTTGGTKIYEQYRESNDFTNPNAAALTNVGLWDFSLRDVSGTPGTAYCFRVENTSGSIGVTYGQYPEVLVVGDYGIEIVDASGVTVASPSVPFGGLTALTSTCQTATGTLGVSAQRIRITNDLLTNGWNASLAATGGPTVTWTSGPLQYDFNDSGGSPAGCLAGQLTVNPTVATVTPKSGCTTAGVSVGSNAAFTQGVVNAITVTTASSSASRFCYWDITGVGLQQRVPAGTQPGTYGLDMTLTMTAL
jgi:hypothetical protein